MNSYALMFVLTFALLIGVSAYVYKVRKKIDEMHGMMAGMTLGMIAGLAAATIYLIPTGNFLIGVIIGSVIGLIFGVPFGRLGGHLGIVEGVMAGPMGGMMGAMLGQMIRPFSIEVFMPFFTFIILISMLGITYAIHCGGCCGKKPTPATNKFITAWAIAAVILLGASVILTFKLTEATPTTSNQQNDVKLPAYLQQITAETQKETTQKDGYQEIDMTIANSAYSPNVILAKKGIPLKINVKADETAGCASEIVIPDFKIRKITGPGTSSVIELMPEKEGTYKFHCSMDMAKGKIIVQ